MTKARWVRLSDGTEPPRDTLTLGQRLAPSGRGWVIIALGLAAFARGLTYAAEPVTVSYKVLSTLTGAVPASYLAVVWIVFGVGCLVSVACRRWALVLSISAGLHGFWALAFLAVVAWAPHSAGLWVAAANYMVLTVVSIVTSQMVDRPYPRARGDGDDTRMD